MSFRFTLFLGFLLLNLMAYLSLRRSVSVWVSPGRRRRVLDLVSLAVCLLNIPLLVFFIRQASGTLHLVSPAVLQIVFYPAMAWLTTIIIFFFIAGPSMLIWSIGKALVGLVRKGKHVLSGPPPPTLTSRAPAVSRRSFIAGSTGLMIPAIYGMAAYGAYGSMGEIDISEEIAIPLPHLPRSLDGLTIVQLSDLHVGPYIREKELQHVVSLTNDLRPDVVVITGDILDRSLSSLPDAVRGLTGIKAPLGVFTVLGNHDISSDRFSYSENFRGGGNIDNGLQSIGIRTLRNQVIRIGSGQDQLALLGLDWLSTPGSRSFYSYQRSESQRQLARMTEEAGPETPTVLLAHHPHTFMDAAPLGIGLTLSGHTHGGGQIILATVDGVPIGIATLRFKYLSGLYKENGCSLYVNRGIGYLGIPIRINCPPEISRFKVISAASAESEPLPS